MNGAMFEVLRQSFVKPAWRTLAENLRNEMMTQFVIDEQLLRVGGFTGYSAAGGIDCITLLDVKIQGLEWFTRIGFPGCLLIVLYG